ncbi:hypothetical protein X942_5599 [Burkholderia pseudomallei MSHR5596]|nr:hypothetical protein X942_5599 [Burkholderia pseudomallei MSHR5596]
MLRGHGRLQHHAIKKQKPPTWRGFVSNLRPAEAGPSTREVRRYFVAPPSNHAAIFVRSSSVMCVTLPIGIAFNCTAC